MDLTASFVRASGNRKTGPIPTTMTHSSTCPDTCPWKKSGCYAKYYRTGGQWKQLDKGGGTKIHAISWDELCDRISKLPKGQIWRHNVTGDLPGIGNVIDCELLNQLVEANAKIRGKGFTYSHKPIGMNGQYLVNACAIYAANKSGFTISLSADGLKQADVLADFNIAPVVAVVETLSPKVMKTPAGRHAIVCPAEEKVNGEPVITCDRCQLCAKMHRAIVCFRAHGTAKEIVNRKLRTL